MNLKETIYKRKSVRSYTGVSVDAETIDKIMAFVKDAKPLYPDIVVRAEIVEKDEVKCILPWITPQLIAIFSEKKEGAWENVGFIFQQLDLYLQSLELGACWLGMGHLHKKEDGRKEGSDGLEFMMLLTFGYPKEDALRSDVSEFKRKKLSDISDQQDERLEPARLAPSSINSQPWYFVHDGDVIHTYCAKQGIINVKHQSHMNRIDIGIALAHMYIANEESFEFFMAESPKEIKGHTYIGSFLI